MKESYGEGVATHTGPESCVSVREGGGEALTGGSAGRVLNREMPPLAAPLRVLRGADALAVSGRPHGAHREGEVRSAPARSQTPCMHGHTAHGNREILRPPGAAEAPGRIGKSQDTRR